MLRILRSRSRRSVLILSGLSALVLGFLLLNFGGFLSKPDGGVGTGSATPQLAAADRSADRTATRGAPRTPEGSTDQQSTQLAPSPTAVGIKDAAATTDLVAPADQPDSIQIQAAEKAAADKAAADKAAADKAAADKAAADKTAADAAKKAAAPAPPAPAPAPPKAAAPTAIDTSGVSSDMSAKLDSIATCESHKNPQAYNSSGPYYGAFQFTQSTWNGIGMSGKPTDYSYDQQKAAAAKLAARSGLGQWPVCSKR